MGDNIVVNMSYKMSDFEDNWTNSKPQKGLKRKFWFDHKSNRSYIRYTISPFQITVTYQHPWRDFNFRYKVVDGKLILPENKLKGEEYDERQFVMDEYIRNNPVVMEAILEINEKIKKQLGV